MARVEISSSGDCDLISTMPDPILHHILGLLKTKEAVQTCVLSKRWQHIWTSLPSLDFDSREFTALKEPQCDSEEEDSIVQRACDSTRFSTFVTTVLLRRKLLHLDVFRLSYGALDSDNVLLKEWVNYVVQHNARVVHLAFLYLPPPSLLHHLYTFTSLEELYLHYRCKSVSTRTSIEKVYFYRCERASSKYTSRGAINLPNLKRLSIHNDFLYKNELKNLLSGCPLLQYLLLEKCHLEEDEIAHESLPHLTIVDCQIPSISATNLVTFKYISSWPTATLNMPSVTYALLELPVPMIRGWEGLASFFSSLVNVEVLELEVPFAQLEEEYVLPELPISLLLINARRERSQQKSPKGFKQLLTSIINH